MAAIDSTQRPEIYVNGSRLSAADGRYSFTAGGVGEHQFSGYILMKGKDGEMIRRNFVQKYTVLPVPNTATVAADLMNVLYAGYANPISISVPGVPANAISATMSRRFVRIQGQWSFRGDSICGRQGCYHSCNGTR